MYIISIFSCLFFSIYPMRKSPLWWFWTDFYDVVNNIFLFTRKYKIIRFILPIRLLIQSIDWNWIKKRVREKIVEMRNLLSNKMKNFIRRHIHNNPLYTNGLNFWVQKLSLQNDLVDGSKLEISKIQFSLLFHFISFFLIIFFMCFLLLFILIYFHWASSSSSSHCSKWLESHVRLSVWRIGKVKRNWDVNDDVSIKMKILIIYGDDVVETFPFSTYLYISRLLSLNFLIMGMKCLNISLLWVKTLKLISLLN